MTSPPNDALLLELHTLLTSGSPPPFVYVHDPSTARATGVRVRTWLHDLSSATALSSNNGTIANELPAESPLAPGTLFLTAFLSAVSAFTPRLIYDTCLNSLATHMPSWEHGCTNYAASAGLDGFIHGLQTLHHERSSPEPAPTKLKANGRAKGKAKAPSTEETSETLQAPSNVHFVIAIERAERLASDLLVPLSRLSELSRVPFTLLLISASPYSPPPGSVGTAALNPYRVFVQPPTKEATLAAMSNHFQNATPRPSLSELRKAALAAETAPKRKTAPARTTRATRKAPSRKTTTTTRKPSRTQDVGDVNDSVDNTPSTSQTPAPDTATLHPYHPALRPLYAHYCSALYGACSPFVHDPHDLAYIAAGRWPGFVQPVLDHVQARIGEDSVDKEHIALGDDERLRLIRRFMPSFSAAMDALHPRLTHAKAWARTNALVPDPGPSIPATPRKDKGKARAEPSPAKRFSEWTDTVGGSAPGYAALPMMSKYIVLAAFLASANPPKSDVRMFGRGRDSKGRRRKGGGMAKVRAGAKSGAAKVPQRLLGPAPFPLDRMLAILGLLLDEYDLDNRLVGEEYTLLGEYTEMEVGRVWIAAAVNELAAMRLLQRAALADRIDGPPAFRCALPYEDALALGRELKVPVLDLMWESV
ncbi:hypothetical protein FA95DRAFT_1556974 [Auriscalpium vulgare]|uniref:Uncharacterized protein n=1 Tax=Auriscalpium vulgare TaxID=40419 RepID=A0ACB8S0E4_9AGAM|nr:hypothetical protein FA95DRAFT_1556974 [Auriscalpium vulgare]